MGFMKVKPSKVKRGKRGKKHTAAMPGPQPSRGSRMRRVNMGAQDTLGPAA